MIRMVAIDPGEAGQGNAVAAFVGEVLVDAWFERVPTFTKSNPPGPPTAAGVGAWVEGRGSCDLVVIERPQQDGRSHDARPIDLINLTRAGYLLAGSFAGRDGCPIVEYHPGDNRDARCPVHSRAAMRRELSNPVAAARVAVCSCVTGWKGSEAKPAQHARLWKDLSAPERRVLGGAATWSVIDAARNAWALSRGSRPGDAYYPKKEKWPTQDLLDAAALGKHHLGLLPRVG